MTRGSWTLPSAPRNGNNELDRTITFENAFLDEPQRWKCVLEAFYSDTWSLCSAIGPQNGVKGTRLRQNFKNRNLLTCPKKENRLTWTVGDAVGTIKWRQKIDRNITFKKRVPSTSPKGGNRLRAF